jgi:hypothetical protein
MDTKTLIAVLKAADSKGDEQAVLYDETHSCYFVVRTVAISPYGGPQIELGGEITPKIIVAI